MIGLRELVMIALVALTLYGRSGVLQGPKARAVMPWLSPVRRSDPRVPTSGPRSPGRSLARGDRLFWFLAILAGSAVAAWIATRTLIATHASP